MANGRFVTGSNLPRSVEKVLERASGWLSMHRRNTGSASLKFRFVGKGRLYFFVVLLAILALTSPVVSGESHYWMPTFGVSWAGRTIDVSIASSPSMAMGRDMVVKAAETWNEAQLWFRAMYFPNGNVYTFLIGKRPLNVLVDFTDYWTVSNYCPSTPFGVEGCTTLRFNYSGNITQAIVFLDIKRLINPDNDSMYLVLHEFGHALGLPDLPWSSFSLCTFQDLMCLYYRDEYPSTLDLYALHELAGGNHMTNVVLPSNIPYAYYLPPESPNMPSTVELATRSTTLSSSVTPSLQSEKSTWLTGFILAGLIGSGTVILFAIITKKLKPSSP